MLWCALVKGGFIEGRAHPNPPASQIRPVWSCLEAFAQASEWTPRLTIKQSLQWKFQYGIQSWTRSTTGQHHQPP